MTGALEAWEKSKKQERLLAEATRELRKGRPQLESMKFRTDAESTELWQILAAGVQGEITMNGTRKPSSPVDVIGGVIGSQKPPFSSKKMRMAEEGPTLLSRMVFTTEAGHCSPTVTFSGGCSLRVRLLDGST